MYTISNNGIITLNRGDSFTTPLFINKGTELSPVRFTLSENPGTKVYLGVMEPNQCFEKAIIRKVFSEDSTFTSDGDLIIELKPQDTLNLHPGKYYYQVKLLFPTGEVLTIIPETLFIIC